MKKTKFLMIAMALFLGLSLTAQAQVDADLIGKEAPDFSLKNIDGKTVSLSKFKNDKGVIVIFTCNHCPYSKLYEDRIVALDAKYKPLGYPVVAINPNDAKAYPDDSPAKMKVRAKEKGFTFPYLVDESQAIAKAYAATRTPHVYLVQNENGKSIVRYVGAIDDNAQDATAVGVKYLEDAIAKVGSGQVPDPANTKAIGCGIKWKKNEASSN
ncbi:MAG: thioredoxin family protein [Bacteroidia bacterium]